MKRLLVGLLLVVGAQTWAAELEKLWHLDGFLMPESVVYDHKRDHFYVSNINDGITEMDGNGSISRVHANGQLELEWVTGLSSPKGLYLHKNLLYVADVKELVVIDVKTQQVTERYTANDAVLLNDVTVTKRGVVYVSDWMGNAIYQLKNGQFSKWLESEGLEFPNGLYAKGKHLYLGAWGKNPQPDFTTLESGKLKKISLKTKVIEDLTDGQPWINFDGVEAYKKGWLATDFISGTLHQFTRSGELVESYPLRYSSADLAVAKKQNLILIPYLFENRVEAYRIKD